MKMLATMLLLGALQGMLPAGNSTIVTSTEGLPAPLGLGTQQPRLSWHVAEAAAVRFPRAATQLSYQVQLAGSAAALLSGAPGKLLCDSGTVASASSSLVQLADLPGVAQDARRCAATLLPGSAYWWRVRLTFQAAVGAPPPPMWSVPARFTLAPTNFSSSRFIGLAKPAAPPPLGGYFVNPCVPSNPGCRCPVPGYASAEYTGCTWWVDNTTVPHTRHFVNNCDKNRQGCGPPQLKCWPHFTKGLAQSSISASAMNALNQGSNYSCDMNNFSPGHGTLNQSSCPWLRKSFTIPASPLSSNSSSSSSSDGIGDSVGLVYVASVGYHELWINGQKVNEDVLSPSVSNLAKRVLMRTYDVSAFLKAGQTNTIGIWLSSGWSGFDSVNPEKEDMFNGTMRGGVIGHS